MPSRWRADMDAEIRNSLAAIRSADRTVQGDAYAALLEATEGPVAWAYEAWGELLGHLASGDNRLRSIASQLLVNLARSDPEGRILKDFAALVEVTRDERFVTARHCLLALWKVGLAGGAQRRLVLEGLAGRFADCAAEKNRTLIRYDIALTLRKLYDATGDDSVRAEALALIGSEPDAKYRKKYAAEWKGA
jgi:hypothetical protein